MRIKNRYSQLMTKRKRSSTELGRPYWDFRGRLWLYAGIGWVKQPTSIAPIVARGIVNQQEIDQC